MGIKTERAAVNQTLPDEPLKWEDTETAVSWELDAFNGLAKPLSSDWN